ncbi:MAG TPA: SET domain-containing protein [Anaerolineales bacterium]|nr:SET domain-containing protein [Anaerolineales bacterium]
MSYQTEPITMWFDRRLVLRMSPIHGIGTFATHDIDAGELLMLVTGGLIVRSEDKQPNELQLAAEMYNQETLAENIFIVTPKLFHYYINHSCEPNAIDISRHANSTQYVALRQIRANEEVTADYYDETTLEVCACKSPRCRWSILNH